MLFFDGHCDTVIKVLDKEFDFITGEGTGSVSFPDMVRVGVCTQLFACFVLSKTYPNQTRQRAKAMIETINSMAAATEGKMKVALTADDVKSACSGGPIAAIIGLEGADPLEGEVEALRHFFALGVRSLIIAWADNPFSGAVFGSGSPLTAKGTSLVELAEELRIMIDLSHISDQGFYDVLQISCRPFIASHSNCRAICPSTRNLTDDMIRKLADRGGVMGINFSSGFLSPHFHQRISALRKEFSAYADDDDRHSQEKRIKAEIAALERPKIDWIAQHVKHAINVGGEDCIALGGDLDGVASTPQGIDRIGDYPKITQLLDREGFTLSQIEKICFRNLTRVFTEVLP
ncbi:dipeptidase [Candidatus Acetothermia bacterium]|nr:dipeptidase [Candidatus Acetothermia bacterium]